jgi:peptidyl-tRNA hydrolase
MLDGRILLGNTRWKSAGLAKALQVEGMNQIYAMYSRAKIEGLPLELT